MPGIMQWQEMTMNNIEKIVPRKSLNLPDIKVVRWDWVKHRHFPNCKYIGRGSPLGNPFIIGKDGTREQVIAKYSEHFNACMEDKNSEAHKEIKNLLAWLYNNNETILFLCCYCAPKACHGDVIRAYLMRNFFDEFFQHKKNWFTNEDFIWT